MEDVTRKIVDGFYSTLSEVLQPKFDSNLTEDQIKSRRTTFLSIKEVGYPVTELDLHPEKLIASDDLETKKDGENRQMLLSNFLNQNVDLSTIVDIDRRQVELNSTAEQINDSYWNCLVYAEPKNKGYDEEAFKEAEKIREVLYVKKERTDPFTGEKTEVVVPSPILQAYIRCEQEYNKALVEYATARQKGLNTTPENLELWETAIREVKLNDLKIAEDKWKFEGFKLEVETNQGKLANLEDRSPTVMIDGYKEAFKKAKKTDPETNIDYYYTALYPSDFVFGQNGGWTKFVFDSKNYKADSKSKSKGGGFSTGADGTLLALFDPVIGLVASTAGAGGGFGKDNESLEKNLDMNNFYAEFELATLKIFRPWMETNLFENSNWVLSKDAPKDFVSKGLVDGLPAGGGLFDHYTSEIIIIRNAKFKFDDLKKKDSVFNKSTHGKAHIKFLFVNLKLGGSHTESHSTATIDQEQGLMTIDGMQVIGNFVQVVPTSPVSQSSEE